MTNTNRNTDQIQKTHDNVSPVEIDAYGVTDRGDRELNEDQFLVAEIRSEALVRQTSLRDSRDRVEAPPALLTVVADGMGGHDRGRLASRLAIEAVCDEILGYAARHPLTRARDGDLDDVLRRVLRRGQARIEEHSDEASRTPMGTTLTMALVAWPTAHIAHVGDTRCYLLRAGQLHQLTQDHTLATSLIRSGAMLPSEADGSLASDVLTNALGAGEDALRVETHRVILAQGDRLLLCTDGVHDNLSDGAIATILGASDPAGRTAAMGLLDAAREVGGRDIRTALVATFHAPPSEQEAAATDAACAMTWADPGLRGMARDFERLELSAAT